MPCSVRLGSAPCEGSARYKVRVQCRVHGMIDGLVCERCAAALRAGRVSCRHCVGALALLKIHTHEPGRSLQTRLDEIIRRTS